MSYTKKHDKRSSEVFKRKQHWLLWFWSSLVNLITVSVWFFISLALSCVCSWFLNIENCRLCFLTEYTAVLKWPREPAGESQRCDLFEPRQNSKEDINSWETLCSERLHWKFPVHLGVKKQTTLTPSFQSPPFSKNYKKNKKTCSCLVHSCASWRVWTADQSSWWLDPAVDRKAATVIYTNH